MTTLGFIGLGHMGSHMARHLVKAGFKVSVYDIVPQAMAAVVQSGAIAASSVATLVKQANVVITSVQTSAQVSELCLSPDGIFAHSRPDLLFIDCSSIDVSTTRLLHTEAEKHHISMLDAPVSGGVAGAEAATLTIMVGGSDDDFQRAQPVLTAIGKKIFHAGAAGSGQAAKICNNLLLGISMIGVCEAFVLAEKMVWIRRNFLILAQMHLVNAGL